MGLSLRAVVTFSRSYRQAWLIFPRTPTGWGNDTQAGNYDPVCARRTANRHGGVSVSVYFLGGMPRRWRENVPDIWILEGIDYAHSKWAFVPGATGTREVLGWGVMEFV